MNKKFRLRKQDSEIQDPVFSDDESVKEIARYAKQKASSNDFSITPISDMRDITNFSYTLSSQYISNLRRDLRLCEGNIQKNRIEQKANRNFFKRVNEANRKAENEDDDVLSNYESIRQKLDDAIKPKPFSQPDLKSKSLKSTKSEREDRPPKSSSLRFPSKQEGPYRSQSQNVPDKLSLGNPNKFPQQPNFLSTQKNLTLNETSPEKRRTIPNNNKKRLSEFPTRDTHLRPKSTFKRGFSTRKILNSKFDIESYQRVMGLCLKEARIYPKTSHRVLPLKYDSRIRISRLYNWLGESVIRSEHEYTLVKIATKF
jgi:hypothetical protein